MDLPDPPEAPLPTDCCNSGCTPCVLDVYESLMHEWEEECERIKSGVCVYTKISEHQPILLPTTYTCFKVVSVSSLTQDTNLYRFQAVLANENEENSYCDVKCLLKFEPSQYFVLQAAESLSDKFFTRAYTPISTVDLSCDGCFEVLIKLYPSGKMSKYIQKLIPGDLTMWRGPYGGLAYKANTFKHIIMLCAGTGVAPMYSLAQSIVCNEFDETIMKMLFCCKDQENIILLKELHKLQSFWNFKADIFVPYTEETDCKPLYGETLKTARITHDEIELELRNKNSAEVLVLICGSSKFCEDMNNLLKTSSVPLQNVHIF